MSAAKRGGQLATYERTIFARARPRPERLPHRKLPVIDAALEVAERSSTLRPLIREQIFTSELAEQVRQVREHTPQLTPPAPLPEVIAAPQTALHNKSDLDLDRKLREESLSALFSEVPSPLDASILRHFYQLHLAAKPTVSDFRPILYHLCREMSADAQANLLYDSRRQVFATLLDHGLDESTRQNLCFGLTDPYVDRSDYCQRLRWTSTLRSDHYFTKRFSSEMVDVGSEILSVTLDSFGIQGMVLFFYQNGGEALHTIPEPLSDLLRDLLPPVERFRTQLWPQHHALSDVGATEQLYQELRSLSAMGKEEIEVVFLNFRELLSHSSWQVLLQRGVEWLRLRLAPEERVVVVSPSRIVLILRSSSGSELISKVRETAGKWGFRIAAKSFRFPQDGQNLFNYTRG